MVALGGVPLNFLEFRCWVPKSRSASNMKHEYIIKWGRISVIISRMWRKTNNLLILSYITCPSSFVHHIFIHQSLPKPQLNSHLSTTFSHFCLCKLEAHVWDEEGTKICFREAVMNHNLPTTCCGHLSHKHGWQAQTGYKFSAELRAKNQTYEIPSLKQQVCPWK